MTILEMLPEIAKDAALAVNWHLKECLETRKVDVETNVRVLELLADGVVYETADGDKVTVPADTIVVATGYRSNEELKEELDAVGDAIRARKVGNATREGYVAGREIS